MKYNLTHVWEHAYENMGMDVHIAVAKNTVVDRGVGIWNKK